MKGNQSGVLERAERFLAQEAFPPENQVAWEKGHGRLDRRRLKRVPVTPEEIGLCGCWQVIAVRREHIGLSHIAGPPTDEIAYYCTNAVAAQYAPDELLAAIRGHWDASENGTHYRRDGTFREDACGVSQRGAAQVLTRLPNLALGLHELGRGAGGDRGPQRRVRLLAADLQPGADLAAPMSRRPSAQWLRPRARDPPAPLRAPRTGPRGQR